MKGIVETVGCESFRLSAAKEFITIPKVLEELYDFCTTLKEIDTPSYKHFFFINGEYVHLYFI